jgi:hypothetical protein
MRFAFALVAVPHRPYTPFIKAAVALRRDHPRFSLAAFESYRPTLANALVPSAKARTTKPDRIEMRVEASSSADCRTAGRT